MTVPRLTMNAVLFALGGLVLSATVSAEAHAQTTGPAVDPAATKILKRMTDAASRWVRTSGSEQLRVESASTGHQQRDAGTYEGRP